ncbi:nitroreductase family protein [Spelaeicoccus albus]|uniref:Nitroreductase n=1 Tax=Spelaeicoccus albus TaxID=1280376 RepID=A0A7Z0IH72_9MICO|nr:nitroreductase family protein [Spelaeicoccus albus]NYI67461.1 nitroreductase [Spelaeicoccus albus]
MSIDSAARAADTAAPILPVLSERWSPRAFDPEAVLPEGRLAGALEAARWSPSAANTQPWRFIIGRRGTKAFDKIFTNLAEGNRKWAGSVSALVVNVAELRRDDGTELRWAEYDLGQAVANFSVQAHHEGLHVHQMGGFDAEAIRTAFDLPDRFCAVSVTAVGTIGDPAALPEPYRERESAPRTRRPLSDVVSTGDWEI